MAGEYQAARRFQVAAHAFRKDTHSSDDVGHAREQIVGQNCGVGENDALDRAVRNVALVPQRDVFKRGAGIGPHHAREAANLLAGHGIALVRHRRTATLLAAEGLPNAEIARRVADALALVKLEGVNDRKPRQLSGGQQQRVALARALIIRPKVLLLDEPFSALDRNLRAAMQVELKDIQRKLGVTTIFVTHDQGEALSLSDRIAVIAEGRIRQLGAPGEIYRRPADRFVASFIGDVNVLSARLKRNDGPTATVAVGGARVLVPAGPLKAVEPGGTVDLFLRPEDLRVAREGEAIAVHGLVRTQVYQGAHIDLYVEVPQAASGRVLLRLTAHEGSSVPPPGTWIGIAIISVEAVAFPQMTGGGRTPGT